MRIQQSGTSGRKPSVKDEAGIRSVLTVMVPVLRREFTHVIFGSIELEGLKEILDVGNERGTRWNILRVAILFIL